MARYSISAFLARQTCQIAQQVKTYHPIEYRGTRYGSSQRPSDARWEWAAATLQAHGANNVLDLGCCEGDFVRRASKAGYFALGLDHACGRLMMGSNTIWGDKQIMSGFALAQIDPALVDRLPRFDAVLFLSVLHHIMARNGEPYACELLRRLGERVVGQVLLFEMGTSLEKTHKWASQLPDMGSAPADWVGDFLGRAGYRDVRVLGWSDAWDSRYRRPMFAAASPER